MPQKSRLPDQNTSKGASITHPSGRQRMQQLHTPRLRHPRDRHQGRWRRRQVCRQCSPRCAANVPTEQRSPKDGFSAGNPRRGVGWQGRLQGGEGPGDASKRHPTIAEHSVLGGIIQGGRGGQRRRQLTQAGCCLVNPCRLDGADT